MAELPPLPAPEAQERILHDLVPLPEAWVALEEALGFALTSEVLARRTQPPWDNSAMDGYAVRSADVARTPVTFPVVAVVHAGDQPTRAVGPREAVRIMTGAPMPPGADAVVMQERTRAVPGPGLGQVEIQEPATPRQNVRDAGEDARAGEVLLPAGMVLGIPELSLLAGQGMTSVRVPRRPRVAIVATGDELCRPDEEPQGRIVDTNSVALALGVRRAGGIPRGPRHRARSPRGRRAARPRRARPRRGAHLRRRLRRRARPRAARARAARRGDGLLARGHQARQAAGLRAAREPPGSSALPGNPASSLVTFELFVRPALLRLAGAGPPPCPSRSGPGAASTSRRTRGWLTTSGSCSAGGRGTPGPTRFPPRRRVRCARRSRQRISCIFQWMR